MGFRYLLLAAAIWVGYLIVRHLLRQRLTKPKTTSSQKSVNSVQCKYCGLHLPKDEAIRDGEDHFCNTEHRDAARKQK